MRILTVTLSPAPAAPTAPVMAVLSNDGVAVTRQLEVPLSLLPATADAEVVAVVPATKLSWHLLELPRGTLDKKMFQEANGARLRSVLEGLLEDRLLDEPAQLHFALAPGARSGEPLWVAVCDRAWLRAWLTVLEESGRPAVRIVPEVAPPVTAGQAVSLHFVGSPTQAELIYCGPQGVCVLPWATGALTLLEDRAPTDIRAEPGVAELAEQHFEGRVTVQSNAQRALAAAQSGWDLAQFDFSASSGARRRKRVSGFFATLFQAPQWRAARWAALALVLVNLVGLQTWNWKEQSALNARRNAVRDILTTTFPDVRVVVDAPLQMARAVTDLQRRTGTASGSDMEAMLLQFYTMSAAAVTPRAIEFGGGELKLKGMNAATVTSARIPAKLQGMGYSALMDGDTLTMKQERRP